MCPAQPPPIQCALVRTLLSGEFALTAEITPPISGNAQDLLDKALPLRGVVDAVNVTDGAAARPHLSNVASAGLLVQNGVEPVLQFTCRDRNRIALQSDLLAAGALKVHNILVLGGDDPTAGDQPDTKPVFDLDTGGLITLARTMRDDAILPSGREVASPPNFYIGAADSPIDPPANWKPARLIEKADLGAQFVQTQFCYDMEILERYMACLRGEGLTDRLFILIGTGPIASARSARWMRENLWGVIIPDSIIERLEGAEDEKAEGQRICVEILQQLSELDGVAGAHIMAIRQETAIPDIVDAAQLGPRHRTTSTSEAVGS